MKENETKYVIQTQNLSKAYSGHKVVNQVNMNVPEGSIYGFVGENGSGKTTIMRLLMGLALPSEGTFKLFGLDKKDPNIYKIRKQISAIVEAPSLVPSMNAYDNLKYACLYCKVKDFSIIDKVLKQVGLGDTGKKLVKNFSLGMRQRLGIAVLLLSSPKLLLLDEPMNGLDPEGIKEVRDLIISLHEQGITILISSHILSELEKVATHWGFINKGHLLQEMSAEELVNASSKSILLKHDDIEELEKSVKKIGIKSYKIIGDKELKIFDEIKPLTLLSLLAKEGVEVNNIKTLDLSVEDYYLDLIKEKGVNA